MGRKTRSPEEQARRAKIRELLQASNISSMEDIQSLFRETIAEFMGNGLEAELDESLGHGKYDYKNKEIDNSRNGHGKRTCVPFLEILKFQFPVTERASSSRRSSRRIKPASARIWKKRYFPCMPKA